MKLSPSSSRATSSQFQIPAKIRIHRTSTILAKKIFDCSAPQSPLMLLEKSVTRRESKFIKSTRSQSKKITFQETKEHMIMDNATNIINLPKLPFGKHSTYNEESNFVQKHILLNNNIPTEDQILDMKKVSKIMRLNRKKNHKNNTPIVRKCKNTHIESIKSDGGRLYIENCKEIINNYIKEKTKYSPDSSLHCSKSGVSSPKLFEDRELRKKYISNPKIILTNLDENIRNAPFAFCIESKLSLIQKLKAKCVV
ncbi:hypothetical protein SteCoe_15464 [Stentor coeruleus]|uniref:Uncharacterized protein n=1 Tax=Stentor coeruleus TaxID=5963 RepID=A0A1R2C3E9_9CILI|nr:hypothetical protein SteCoe_15464 [Stentor coeruleus]